MNRYGIALILGAISMKADALSKTNCGCDKSQMRTANMRATKYNLEAVSIVEWLGELAKN